MKKKDIEKLTGITLDLIDYLAEYMGDEWGDDEVPAYVACKKAIKLLEKKD